MGRDDWYRGTDWDAETQELFRTKLARARVSSRAQYLRIKGVELLASDRAAVRNSGRDLLRRVMADYPSDVLQSAWAHRDLGASLAEDGLFDEAAEHLEEALAAEHPEPLVGLVLAEVIVSAKWRHRYGEALGLLTAGDGASDPFPATRFRWNLAAARLSDRLGSPADARELAALALRCLDETQSPFPRHRSLGLAAADKRTRRELQRLAR
jgi:tetratricopeptide (TPR) repeat protein